MDKDLLWEYIDTGLSPSEIKRMYESLGVTVDLISRLIIGDYTSINLAVEDAISFLDTYASLRIKEMN